MRAQLNSVAHAPPHSFGDCFRVCVAAVLDLDATEVPHVFDKGQDGPTAHAAMDAWLALRGLRLVWTAYMAPATLGDVLATLEAYNPGLPAIIGGQSRPGCGHFVVAQHGRVVCDPAPGADKEAALCGPYDDGAWCVGYMGVALS